MKSILQYIYENLKLNSDSTIKTMNNKLKTFKKEFNKFKQYNFTDKNPDDIISEFEKCLKKVDSEAKFETKRREDLDKFYSGNSGARGELVYPEYAYNTIITFFDNDHLISWTQGGGKANMNIDNIKDAISGYKQWYSFVYEIKYDDIFKLFKKDIQI